MHEAAHRRTLVAARVDERLDLALRAASDEHRRATDRCSDEVVRLGQLRIEREKMPAALEHVLQLELEQLRVAEHVAVNAEDLVLRTMVDVQADVVQVHGGS